MKRYQVISILIFLMLFSLVLSGCSEQSELEKYKSQGYVVSVTYDSNGGNFLSRSDVNIINLYNPDDYTASADGTVSITLTEPTTGGKKVSLAMDGYFFAGWYTERTLKTDDDGNVVDWNGNILTDKDGVWYNKEGSVAYPACTSYSGLWDFATDTLDFTSSDTEKSLTLYAGWVPYYEFHYYYRIAGSDSDWTEYATTSFDYKVANAEDSSSPDLDTIYVPSYDGGAMVYTHNYSGGSLYTFPKVAGDSFPSGTTFSKAWSDSSASDESLITGSFEHTGTLDLSTGTAVNPIQNIYVEVLEGTIYKITEASQLTKNASLDGVYYIESDLDFTGLSWPALFAGGTFTGKFYGQGNTLNNITVTYSSKGTYGGLFGAIDSSATISEVTFTNVTVDYSSTGRSGGGYYGLFAGYIYSEANINSVTLNGELNLKIGAISLPSSGSSNPSYLSLFVAGGDTANITCDVTTVALTVYGRYNYDGVNTIYYFSVDPDSVSVSTEKGEDTGTVTYFVIFTQGEYKVDYAEKLINWTAASE